MVQLFKIAMGLVNMGLLGIYEIVNYIPNKTLGFGEVAIDSILSSNTIKTKSTIMQD